jgi:MATE family multidrug resistance protein
LDYFEVRIWAAPATLSLFTLKGWFIGMQDTKSTMVCDIVVNIFNIVASYALAVYTPLGAIGVAYGTLIAQYVGSTIGWAILLYKYNAYLLDLNTWREWLNWTDMRRLIGLNVNLFVRSLCFMVVYVGFTALTSGYGDVLLAVSTIVMKLFMLFSYFIDGFAYAGEALVGRFVGQSDVMQDAQNIRPTTRVLMLWAVGVGLLFTLLYVVASPLFYKMMTSDVRVLEALQDFTPWVIAMPLISALAFMWDGVYIGATAGKQIRNAMIYAAIGFVLGYWLTREQLGIHAVFVGYFMHLVARVGYLTIEWKKVYNDILNKITYETIRES